MNANPLEKVHKELVWERNYGDGLAWIGNGLACIIVGLTHYFRSHYPIFFIFPLFLLVPLVRKHCIRPRMGIAKIMYKPNYYKVVFGTMAMLLILLFIWMAKSSVSTPGFLIWFILAIGLCVSGGMYVRYVTWDGKSSYPILESILLLIILLLFFKLEFNYSNLAVCIGVIGCYRLVYGIATFIRFIKRNPVLSDE